LSDADKLAEVLVATIFEKLESAKLILQPAIKELLAARKAGLR
jgi:hypothetical protein